MSLPTPPSKPTRPLIIPQGHVFRVKTRHDGVRDYRVEKKLGEGGAGIVYRGIDVETGRAVVIKAPKVYGGNGYSSKIEEQVLSSLDHVNIMSFLGSIVDRYGHLICFYEQLFSNPLLFLNMGETRRRVRFRQDPKARYLPLPPSHAINFGFELLRAVEHLHDRGLIHHDIKLGNFLVRLDYTEARISPQDYFKCIIDHRYRGVLIDAGGVRNLDYLEMLNKGEDTIVPPELTPVLAPPEVLIEIRLADGRLTRLWTPTVDLYQCALVIYSMFTGHTPYSHLDTDTNFSDYDDVCNIKRAEHRGQISPIFLDIIKTVRFREDCPLKEVGDHVRARFDRAFFALLKKRVHPDPAQRGTITEFRQDFEKLFQFRKTRRDASFFSLKERQEYNRRHLAMGQTLFSLVPNRNRLWQAGNEETGNFSRGFNRESFRQSQLTPAPTPNRDHRQTPSKSIKRTHIIRGFWDNKRGGF